MTDASSGTSRRRAARAREIHMSRGGISRVLRLTAPRHVSYLAGAVDTHMMYELDAYAISNSCRLLERENVPLIRQNRVAEQTGKYISRIDRRDSLGCVFSGEIKFTIFSSFIVYLRSREIVDRPLLMLSFYNGYYHVTVSRCLDM